MGTDHSPIVAVSYSSILCSEIYKSNLGVNMRKLLPMCVIIHAMFIFNCTTTRIEKPNQKQGFTSPSGRYVLNVPIEEDSQAQRHYWRVTISDTNGTVLFKDDAPLLGRFNVYWYWDKDDRVWLVNSDNGNTYYWEVDNNGRWQRTQWHQDDPKSLSPPPELYPESWRKKK